LNTIVTASLGIVGGVLVAYVGAVLKFRNDLKAEYDKDLRNRRIEAYQGLWHLLQYVGRYDLPKSLTPKILKELSVEMRKWYFGGGGLYLSEESRTTYFDLKQDIKDVLHKTKYHRPNDVPLDPEDSELVDVLLDPEDSELVDVPLDPEDSKLVREKGSLLRKSLTHDVGTRKASALAD
jgi:hypothetical protein